MKGIIHKIAKSALPNKLGKRKKQILKSIVYTLIFAFSASVYAQDSPNSKWRFGLNGKGYTTFNLVSEDLVFALAPYIARSNKNKTFGLGLTIGKTPIVGLYVIDNYPDFYAFRYTYTKTDKLQLNGGFAFYRYYFNSPKEFISLFTEANLAVSYVYNEQHDKYYQDIINTEALVKFGSRINIGEHLSLNISGGAGLNCNSANRHYYRGYINNVGQDYKIYYRAMPSFGAAVGLEYQF